MFMYRCFYALIVCSVIPVVAAGQSGMAINIDSLVRVPRIAADSLPWHWQVKWTAGFSTTQLTNWTQGGQDVFSVDLGTYGSYDYADSILSWDNDLHLRYGVVKQGTQSIQKSDDRIILSSRFSRVTTDWYRYSGFVDFRTQFFDGFNNAVYDSATRGPLRISSFFAPAFLTTAIGLDAVLLPELRVLVAPLSSRSTWVLDSRLVEYGRADGRGVFGLAPGISSSTSVGTAVNIKVDWEVFTNVNWRLRLNGFMPYQTPDLWIVTVENAIAMKVNSWLSVSWMADLFYDDRIPITRSDGTIGPATQFRNQVTFGFNWSMSDRPS